MLQVRIAEILIGSQKTRLGCRPSHENEGYLINCIDQFVERNLPIAFLSLWGATKGYGLFEDYQRADILDVLALKRFASLNEQVKESYKPGCTFRIVMENISECLYHANTEGISTKIQAYRESFQSLIDVLAADCVILQTEAIHLCVKGIQIETFVALALRNKAMFLRHWYSTHLDELEEAGWHGIITESQWRWYLKRVEGEVPHLTFMEKVERVCLYLGLALARRQVRLFESPMPILKASFSPYPPGSNEAMLRGRLEYKLKDSKTSHQAILPWCSYGTLSDGKVKHLCVSELREQRLPQSEINYEGTATVAIVK